MSDLNMSDRPYSSFTFEDGLVLISNGKERYVGNFEPGDVRPITVHDGNEIISSVKFKLRFMDGTESEEFTVAMNELDMINWNTQHPKCLLNPDFSKAKEHLAYIIRASAYDAEPEPQYLINSLGTHIVEGIPMFCAGERIIRSPGITNITDKVDVVLEPQPYRLAIDLERYSEREAAFGMMKIINLSTKVGRLIFSHASLNIMRSVYIAAGVTPCCILYR